MENKKINKDMTIAEILKLDERVEEVLLEFGMHCISCPISQMETLEQASAVHGIELEVLLEQLNEVLESE